METKPRLPRDVQLVPSLPDGQTVKVIGLGGVGGIVTRYGAMFLASLTKTIDSRLVLIDGDSFEASNAARMLFSRAGNKAAVVRDELLKYPYLSDSRLSVVACEEHVTPDNIVRLIHNEDIILLAVDNHATRKLVNDHCQTLDNVVLISGGNDGVGEDSTGNMRRGTFGNCQVYIRCGAQDASPSLTRYHKEIDQPADSLPTESCTEQIASVPQISLVNLTAAAAMLNTLWLYLCGALHYSELAFDVAEGLMRPVPIPAPQMALVSTHLKNG